MEQSADGRGLDLVFRSIQTQVSISTCFEATALRARPGGNPIKCSVDAHVSCFFETVVITYVELNPSGRR